MKKRSFYDLKKEILTQVHENPGIHPNQLNKKVGTNPESLKAHIQSLEDSDEIRVERISEDPANRHPSSYLHPTNRGDKTLENMKKRKKGAN